ncbi:DUF5678 domain-containing protein, partial [Burkholderia sp. SR8]|uniref:DUF5678 domain-containing protein n=1 Tax=Burkholderia sp. SR8 TaxID=3062277 RepID=UPI004062DE6B
NSGVPRRACNLSIVARFLSPNLLFDTAELIMTTNLRDEFEYYLKHQTDLVSQYSGKVVAIKDQKVIGVFDDEIKAVTETQKTFPLGTFLVQRVEPGAQNYTQTYHSRVEFV